MYARSIVPTQQLSMFEVIALASGMLMERYHVGAESAFNEIVDTALFVDKTVPGVARNMVGAAGPQLVTDGQRLDDIAADDLRLLRPEAMDEVLDGGFETAQLAVGVLVERYGQCPADAVDMLAARIDQSTLVGGDFTFRLVDQASQMPLAGDSPTAELS